MDIVINLSSNEFKDIKDCIESILESWDVEDTASCFEEILEILNEKGVELS